MERPTFRSAGLKTGRSTQPMPISRRAFVGAGLTGLAAMRARLASAAEQILPLKPATALAPLIDEDGSRLWLRFAPLGAAAAQYRDAIQQLIVEGQTPTLAVVREELQSGLRSMLGRAVPLVNSGIGAGTIVVGTPRSSPSIRALGWSDELTRLGPEGFVIRPAIVANRSVIAIASDSEVGALYGAFHLLRLVQMGRSIIGLGVAERPKVRLRLLNHWDNLDGTVERGYAGRSLWQWPELPGTISPRYREYARANASIGINGAAINNVNANAAVLSAEYLPKVAALADVFRPYGVRVYLSIKFSAPIELGKLATADPLDADVAAWWKAKADEIYARIPDLGGFLVKANSEGQPGPKDYARTHADGANVLADALAPHNGTVIWRAFIYDEDVDPDRAKRAYLEFTKLDGQFRPNAVVQVKNGPIDFQPREPFHPLFGAMKRTPVMAEIQATQEYLGQARHLVFLGPMWKEFLDSDTHARGPGSTVAKAIEGAIDPFRITGMAAVANPGLDANWCGHHFSQANWYAAGRLAWTPELPAAAIAEEWTRQTFGPLNNDAKTVATIVRMMMTSHETFVNYTMPLGLHHLIGGNHYAPMPENATAPRADWTAVYYHQAAADGVGFNRTMLGNKAVDQYFPPVRDMFNDLRTCPETVLLWFHRCSWDYKLKSGKTLWEGLVEKYQQGAREAALLEATWKSLSGAVDARRHREVAERLAIQTADAAAWRDRVLAYFQQFSKKRI